MGDTSRNGVWDAAALADLCTEAARLGALMQPEAFPSPPRPAPVALTPCTVPKAAFDDVWASMPLMNTLYDRVSCDVDWLVEQHVTVAKADPFIAGLVAIMQRTRVPLKERLRLHVTRSDYLPHSDATLRQVEMNMISVAFAGLSGSVASLQAYAQKYAGPLPGSPVPGAAPAQGVGAALAEADRLYREAHGVEGRTQIAFLKLSAHEGNQFDQRHTMAQVREHGADITFRTFESPWRVEDGRLFVGQEGVDAETEVSVVYMRTGYAPEQYSDAAWVLREQMEQTRAVMVPSCAAQLAGSKKVQEALSRRDALERFVSPEEATQLLKLCVTQVDPSDPSGQEAVAAAIARPHEWVLKPQREGGGNNMHGAELKAKLQAGGEELRAFTLMQKIIAPASQPGVALAAFGTELRPFDGVAELGLFATFIARAADPVRNEAVGAFHRAKDVSTDEGGVNAGFAFLDAPRLV